MLLNFAEDFTIAMQRQMKTLVGLVLVFTITYAHEAINCPSSWTEYKIVKEGSYRHSRLRDNEVIINRLVTYQCSEENVVQFNTTWNAAINKTENFGSFQLYPFDISKTCLNPDCNKIVLNIEVNYWARSQDRRKKWKDWEYLATGENSYLRKNCNKLHWTSWIKTTSCATSLRIMRRRSCMDCDGDALEQKLCDATGHAVNETDCIHFWGNWTEGHCVTIGCNTVGERVRTRQCLYDEGLEAIDVMLCSNGNESAIMSEECINTTIPAECLPQSSSGTGKSDNTGFYSGIGVAVALIVFLCILHVFERCRRHKLPQFPPNNTVNLNHTFPHKCANATVKTSEQSNNVSGPVELSHQHPADAYQFANQSTRANNLSLKGFIPAAQNKQQDELAEEPVAYDIAQIDGSNAQRFEQAYDQDVYEIATPGDQNLYELEDAMQHAESNLSTAQSCKDVLEQSNTYSSLQSSSDVVESTYSKLER